MAGKTSNVIEINGKLYDARSGKLLNSPKKQTASAGSKSQTVASPKLKPAAKPVASRPKSIDGFGPTRGVKPLMTKAKSTPKTSEAKPKHQKAHQPAPNLKHKIQKSRTLNRKSVKAPFISVPEGVLPHAVELKEDISKRLERAMKVSKSSIVSRFPNSGVQSANLDVKPSAKKVSAAPGAKIVHEKITKPKAVQLEPVHQPAKPPRKKRRLKKHFSLAGYIVLALILLATVTYLIYLNVPAVSIKVASYRAEFTGTLPSYTPPGYKLNGPAGGKPGEIKLSYQSTSSNRSFVITQTPTNWDNQALKENYVSKQTDSEPITQQYNGLTVYQFGGKAVWVNGGKQYVVDTNGSQLGVDQVLKLAGSM
jgi:hypothetical protein